VALPGAGGLATLNKVLPHMKYEEKGVGGKPTIQFSGVNVQIVNGEGKTASVNSEGNLVIGYDENPFGRQRTGSHNLVVGTEHTYTSYASLVGGQRNWATAPFTFLVGASNTASGEWASVSGGDFSEASGKAASVSGGVSNLASGRRSSVSGGEGNGAIGEHSAVGGGIQNEASGGASSITGGLRNKATNVDTSVAGGNGNIAGGSFSWVGGGQFNEAGFAYSTVFGGKEHGTKSEYEAIP
jgi:hypothetical protein